MPLRADTSLWYNSPNVMAVYQPVRAPDSFLARFNMARGGDNRYKATPGTLPTWNAATGWTGNASNMHLKTGIILPVGTQASYTLLVRYTNAALGATEGIAGSVNFADFRNGFGVGGIFGGYIMNGQAVAVTLPASGVVGVAGNTAYINGVASGSIAASANDIGSRNLFLLAFNNANAGTENPGYYSDASLYAFGLWNYVLPPAQIRAATRQMAYCDVNPDWSVWSRKRRYYYAPSQAGFLAAWAAHSNAQIGTGAGL